MSEIVFRIDKNLSPERIEEYKRELNKLLGVDVEWTVSYERDMSETEIPADIRELARVAWMNAAVMSIHEQQVEAIADALLAVQAEAFERAALIVEIVVKNGGNLALLASDIRDCKHLSAIRSGQRSGE